jgi:FkbM family methyltransferase
MQTSGIAEYIMKRLLPNAKGSSPGPVQRRIFTLARRVMGARGNNLVRYQLGGSEILLPLSHGLPQIRAAFPQYSTNIARLCSYVSEKYPNLHMIDIGANVGDTAAIVRELSPCPILCVEGDEYYFNILSENIRRAQLNSVQAVRAFVATSTGEIKGHFVSATGTAHFVEDKTNPVKAVKFGDLLSDFPRFQAPKVLKIDTDGFDCSILRSELEWLGDHRPVIFFEYDPFFFRRWPYDGAHIFEDLSTVGYSSAIFYDNYGDYLISVDLHLDRRILAELQNYYIGRCGLRYADVAVFHEEDRGLAESIRIKEAEWCLQLRSQEIGKQNLA